MFTTIGVEPEWTENGPVTIDRDRGEGEDAHVHRQHLDERAKRAHHGWQVPPLQQSRLELYTSQWRFSESHKITVDRYLIYLEVGFI